MHSLEDRKGQALPVMPRRVHAYIIQLYLAADVCAAMALLATKLYVPKVRPNLVTRPHLTERLNQGPGHRLTLISAPAGFGKTTLLAEWASALRANGLTVAWVSLDGSDNDPARFWTYFIAALSKVHHGAGESALSMLQSTQSLPVESVLNTLVNEASVIPHDFALILDDYHLIETQAIHSGLTYLLEHLPPQMHLVIATRTDPPLPLARLRGKGQLVEFRAADLRFTPDEASLFLNNVMALGLSPRHVEALEERTEGWIAGLQLAALSIHDREDIPGFVAAFTGENRYILDYLAQEVLQRQPEEVQTFLLQSSILDRLCGSLCDAVTGRSDGQLMLERMDQANLFLIPLDDKRQWYRYHHLFADFLRKQFHGQQGVLAPELHCRASAWYEGHGFTA
ncbi:MAG TPA: LuxR family transcriptional regulator, partial [Dehalococcoidia bacterium]|nr:LuxR family transcriptional regulator [Dehalococcoidia bacterium]